MENVIYHIRRCQKLDFFMSSKWLPDLVWLNNIFIIIYNNNSVMTVFVPNIL